MEMWFKIILLTSVLIGLILIVMSFILNRIGDVEQLITINKIGLQLKVYPYILVMGIGSFFFLVGQYFVHDTLNRDIHDEIEQFKYIYTIDKCIAGANVPRKEEVGPPILDENNLKLSISGLKEGEVFWLQVIDTKNNRAWRSESRIIVPVSTIELVEK